MPDRGRPRRHHPHRPARRRIVAGEQELFGEFHASFRAACKEAGAAGYIAAKQAEREVRHRRYGDSPFVVEPNVKEGRGGLRDLQTLYWIARYVFGTETMGQLAEVGGILSPSEAKHGRRSWEFLWTVRFHLHYVAGRAEERLTFDLQPVVGARMGYTRHGRQDGVERFMRHYFLTAREVVRLTRVARTGDPARRPRRRRRCRRKPIRRCATPASCWPRASCCRHRGASSSANRSRCCASCRWRATATSICIRWRSAR